MSVSQNTVNKFLGVLKQTTSDGIDGTSFVECVALKLRKANPCEWSKGSQIILTSNEVILPKGLGFTQKDVGKTYLFLQIQDGQRFIFYCERGR